MEDLVTIEDDFGDDQLFSVNKQCSIPEGHRIRKNVIVQLDRLSFDNIPQS